MIHCRCDMGLLIGRKASMGLDWEACWLEWSLLSLCHCCCHMSVWYQHMVGNTLLSVCLFICVPVYLPFLSLCLLPFSQSPAPSVHLLSKEASWVFIRLSRCFLVSLQLKRGREQVKRTFPCTIVHSNTYPRGHLIPFPCFPPAHERCKKLRGEDILSGNLGAAPGDLHSERDRLAQDWIPHTTEGPLYSSTKDASVTFYY